MSGALKKARYTYNNSNHSFGEKYARYANRSPRVPYPYESVAEVPVKWKFQLDFNQSKRIDRSAPAPMAYTGLDDSDWADILIGKAWEDQGYPHYDRGAWYRSEIEIDAKDDLPVVMAFGGIDSKAWIYVNGQYVGEHHHWDKPFRIDISKAVKRKGKNEVAIRVYDGVGMGGIYGLIDIHQPKR